MLALAMLLAACAGVHAEDRVFNVTYLSVPNVVPPYQEEVDFVCRYDADFTLLSWFQGAHEFFRYKPGATPSVRSFPIIGVGSVKMLTCGPVECHLRLGALTKEATGLYRCDVEREVPPYKFASMQAYMEVQGHEHRKPILEGLAKEYKDGDVLEAYCRGSPGSELRWYVNAKEVVNFRGSTYLRKTIIDLWDAIGGVVNVQCVQFRNGHMYGSVDKSVHISNVGSSTREKPEGNEVRNGSSVITALIGLPSILLYLLVKVFYI